MNRVIITIAAFSTWLLISSPVFASPPDDVLDEITIRVIENGNLSINVNDIALPNTAGEHGSDHPAANANANANDNANANANEHAAQGAENAAENAAEAAENAAEIAAEARDNATEAAKNKRNNRGQNKK